jgi:Tol biopolymer transport system component
VMNADGSDHVNLTQNAATAEHPTWSPDGGRIAYEQSGGAAQAGVWSMNADGSAQEIVAGTVGGSHPDWSPDGREIAFVASFGTVNRDLWAVPSTGGEARKVAALTEPVIPPSQHAGAEWPSWSANGVSLAFSGEPTYEIYSVAAAGGTPVNLTDNGTSSIDLFPSWSPRP